MTAVKLPGQLEVPLVVGHAKKEHNNEFEFAAIVINGDPSRNGFSCEISAYIDEGTELYTRNESYKKDSDLCGVRLARMLKSYDESPTSQKWIDIQVVSRDILR